jgi:hypothetical protein
MEEIKERHNTLRQSTFEFDQAKIYRDQTLMILDAYFDLSKLKRKQIYELDDLLFRTIMNRFRNIRENFIENIKRDERKNRPYVMPKERRDNMRKAAKTRKKRTRPNPS